MKSRASKTIESALPVRRDFRQSGGDGSRLLKGYAWDAFQLAGKDDGASMVEAAVSLCIMISFLLGTFQMALALYTYHFVSDAAREASRYAIVRGSASCTNTPNLSNCNVTSDQVQTWVRNLGYPGIDPTRLTVTTSWPTTGSSCWPSSSPCNNPSNVVNVNVAYNFAYNVPFWKAGAISIQSASQMVISQ